ncbi:MAG: hypothetical protein UX13_C0031G0005 [Candidatus Woesebacteria bacterium GW2011_GWB1_45_5]|uniref:Uncharacterized protein n=1 Tax=Candidatus Woesebacteria bacterium GW2011_GWB1_45_5 TaxID=1618581 RepID=A0A0G1MN44_9BACT|nr:MAG: hypothetical protein UX13_C0031G0005 [Candidatus Woesebacteria bacterium GW2011_GWB1_45_5]
MKKPNRILFWIGLVGALVAFELFNYSTTKYALSNLFDITFAGMSWAIVLAIAFCAIDYAGISRAFTPNKPTGDKYLLPAWFLVSALNAGFTLLAVLIANPELPRYVAFAVAMTVWTLRVLIVGAFWVTGERMFKS